jgi:hypothetical protein
MRDNKRCADDAASARLANSLPDKPVRAHRHAAARLGLSLLLLACATLPCTEQPRTAIAVLDFGYLDTSGEARDQSAYHGARVQEFARAMREGLEHSQRFRVVALTCKADPCSLTATQPAELVAAARRSGARLLFLGGFHKQSTLVQWAKAQVIDVQSEQIVFDRHLSFRGDDEAAWRHAQTYLLKELLAQPL